MCSFSLINSNIIFISGDHIFKAYSVMPRPVTFSSVATSCSCKATVRAESVWDSLSALTAATELLSSRTPW
ncbi:hypothetical protein E2C01_006888 [Portunus trituberculatus]|uniref:Uncharacterized protein n=1 Tax=Portunus trituberculatus TaxID=210409 RepID=A0A5B7D309_PORTR|nr:hypothetical protein [Portunus trituberculatus]